MKLKHKYRDFRAGNRNPFLFESSLGESLEHNREDVDGSGLTPKDYFEKQGKTVAKQIETGLSTDVNYEVKVPTAAGFENYNDSGMVVEFTRDGERYRAILGTKLDKGTYSLKMLIEDSKGKTIYEKESKNIENIHRLSMIIAPSFSLAFLPAKE